MECPDCGSSNTLKNGHRQGKQNNICAEKCTSLVLGLRGIERVKGVDHTTVITWVKALGLSLPDA